MIQNDVYIEKLGMAFQGGAFKFHYLVGIIQIFEENGKLPDYLEGVSAGTLASVFWAMGKTKELYALADQLLIEQHKMIWTSQFVSEVNGKLSVNVEALMQYLGVKGNANTLWRLATNKKKFLQEVGQKLKDLPSLADNTPLFDLLSKHVTIAEMKIPFKCRFTCYDTGETVSVGPEDFDDDNEYRKALWASATMPIFWKLIESIRLKSGKVYYNCGDGGVRDNSPIMSTVRYIDQDPTPNNHWGIVAANCNNDFLPELFGPINMFDAAGRTFSIFMDEMGKGDFETFEVVNRIAKANGGSVTDGTKNYRYYNYAKIEPYENELGNSLSTNPVDLRNRLRLGRKHAQAYFQAQTA